MTSTTAKVKDVLHMNKDKSTTHHNNVPEGTAGPHSSRVANAADPRVDSDMDRSRGTHTTGTTGTTGTGAYAGTGPNSGTGTTESGTTTAGPHKSNIANKADPRVDSDLDGSRNTGAAFHTGTTGAHSGTGAASHNTAGYSSGTGPAPTTAGPHSSSIANKADPRIDSDLDGSRNMGGATSHTGTNNPSTGNVYSNPHAGHTGVVSHSTTTGATSGPTGTGVSSATPGSGNAPNTAGPHSSDILNKLDPRVDSDLSGGKTYGGNKTHT